MLPVCVYKLSQQPYCTCHKGTVQPIIRLGMPNTLKGICLIFFMYVIQNYSICRPSDSTVSEDAGIEPRTVATLTLTARRSNNSARSRTKSARSHPNSARSHLHSARSHPHLARSHLIHTRLDLIHTRLGLIQYLYICTVIKKLKKL
jgi:hypothetical protein